MGDYDLGNGRVKALLLAGPIFVILMGLASMPPEGSASPTRGLGVFIVLLIMAFAVPFGALFSVLPILLLTKLLAFIGYRNPGLRHPAMWALAGGAVTAPWLPWHSVSQTNEGFSIAVTGTSLICALLCRSSVVWHD